MRIDVGLTLSIDGWLNRSIDFIIERGGWVRRFSCEFFLSWNSNRIAFSRIGRRRRSMSGVILPSIFIMVCRSMRVHRHRSTPLGSAETHGALDFEVSFLKLFISHHLPEIIIYDGIYVVFSFVGSFLSSESFLPLYSLAHLNYLGFKFSHLSP